MDALKLNDFQIGRTKYLTFSNQDGKQWSIPVENSRVALEIYEPSGIKGRMLKKFFPIILKIGLARFVLNGRYTNVHLSEELKKILERCFGLGFEYSIFWGTPCIDQKITIQIYKEKKILGYCKVGHSERVKELFFHEKKVLDFLEEKGIRRVAKCLELQQVDKQCWAFVQSTEKEIGAQIEGVYGEKHEQFLETLWQDTHRSILFEETDFYQNLVFLEQNLELLEEKYRVGLQKALFKIEEHYQNSIVKWGVSHQDFTPWNTCIVGEELFVFDFEYSLLHAPKGIDRWHFFVQTKVFYDKCSMQQISETYLRLDQKDRDDLLFMCYLLNYISLYLQRGGRDDILSAEQRAELLCLIIR